MNLLKLLADMQRSVKESRRPHYEKIREDAVRRYYLTR